MMHVAAARQSWRASARPHSPHRMLLPAWIWPCRRGRSTLPVSRTPSTGRCRHCRQCIIPPSRCSPGKNLSPSLLLQHPLHAAQISCRWCFPRAPVPHWLHAPASHNNKRVCGAWFILSALAAGVLLTMQPPRRCRAHTRRACMSVVPVATLVIASLLAMLARHAAARCIRARCFLA